MMSKMAVRKHLPNMSNFHILEMLRFSLWGPDIFPEEAFENLRNRNPGKNIEALLGIKAKLPGDIQGTTAGTSSRATEPTQKKQKLTHQIIQTQSSQGKQGWNKRGSRCGKKHNRGKNNKQNSNGNGKSNQTHQNQSRNNNNQGKSFQKGKK